MRAGHGPRGLLWGLGLVLAALLLAGAWEVWTWPRVRSLATRPPATTAFIERYREAQRAAGRVDRVAWTWVPYAAISPHLKRAVLAAEDIGFFDHQGFDLSEMRASLEKAVEEGEVPRGASTITQQLAKNLWLSPSRNPWRKVKEAILTWQLERSLPKRRILELYLNVVQFGRGVYGAEAAARHFFGHAAADLTDDEAAQLAAGLPRPSLWHPGVTSRAYQAYVQIIRRRMARAEFLLRLVGHSSSADNAQDRGRPPPQRADDGGHRVVGGVGPEDVPGGDDEPGAASLGEGLPGFGHRVGRASVPEPAPRV